TTVSSRSVRLVVLIVEDDLTTGLDANLCVDELDVFDGLRGGHRCSGRLRRRCCRGTAAVRRGTVVTTAHPECSEHHQCACTNQFCSLMPRTTRRPASPDANFYNHAVDQRLHTFAIAFVTCNDANSKNKPSGINNHDQG